MSKNKVAWASWRWLFNWHHQLHQLHFSTIMNYDFKNIYHDRYEYKAVLKQLTKLLMQPSFFSWWYLISEIILDYFTERDIWLSNRRVMNPLSLWIYLQMNQKFLSFYIQLFIDFMLILWLLIIMIIQWLV